MSVFKSFALWLCPWLAGGALPHSSKPGSTFTPAALLHKLLSHLVASRPPLSLPALTLTPPPSQHAPRRHLRLLQCCTGDPHIWCIARRWPALETLVIKEAPGAGCGLGNSGASVIAAQLASLRSLAVTLLPRTDVSPLGSLGRLERLLLDGRSNAEVAGWQGLTRLSNLRSLVLPLLQMQQDPGGALAALAAALRNCAILNVSASLGAQHGTQWFGQFAEGVRDWWRPPAAPWEWHPHLGIRV